MRKIKTPIIPIQPTFAKVKGDHELNKEAICIFAATGFFLDRDTYWKDVVALPPASINQLDADGFLVKCTPWFQWHYTPRTISFNEALQEFTTLFETIVEEQIGNKKTILPLSGGLDSRSQAVVLKKLGKEVSSYSYDFDGGYPETQLAQKIATACDFDFKPFQIEKGYVWNVIEELAKINQCNSDFTHPRQMAIIDKFEAMGDVFSLGHWGDVLFDSGTDKTVSENQLTEIILKKLIKKGGMELGNALWHQWKLEGTFEHYLHKRINTLLDTIKIKNVSAKVRAFKSLYWAPRWTSVNLSVFIEKRPVTLPYYDDRMCEFICTIPEEFLADRKLQIAYIKAQSPKLAKITWQDHRPFNLYNYGKNRIPYNLPYRIIKKAQRESNALVGKKYIQRNWELQFLGKENATQLESYLFSNPLKEWVSEEVIQAFYNAFKEKDAVTYSHPVSMLLTLALWKKNNG
ncbi:asparagine synthase-related protein [Marixanthomonas ophiurae]|uniref:asparagine synthase (glutamine-hydrolyzing) n=1 Tax=Marixanthomonas ophiurae TaxID=387659 RepID=A0A3E1QED4_9FLAO|nr:asparagine synthase-related protein [Marixanthomonas ophiurae]RFN60509.1 asparagine synthetase B family protein [Marixanthomonas ophiurae]